jgi:hypothetical protein
MLSFDSGHNDVRSPEIYESIVGFVKKKFALLKYDNFKPTKKEASIGPKKIFEDHISLCLNSGSFSKETLNDLDDINSSFKRNEKRKKLVYYGVPNKQVDLESDKRIIAPIGEPSESFISEANFIVTLPNINDNVNRYNEDNSKSKHQSNFGKINIINLNLKVQ